MSNEEVYKDFSKHSTELQKRRLTFYEHLLRMGDERMAKHIFKYLRNMKTKFRW